MKQLFLRTSRKDNLQDFIDRLHIVGIDTEVSEQHGKYYIKSTWNEEEIPFKIGMKHKNCGAPKKQLTYNDKPVSCGTIYKLRENGYSDLSIAQLLNTSESTVARRRKQHTSDNEFYSDSQVIF